MNFENSSFKAHLLVLITFNLIVFPPIIGQGFIHDDFAHLYSASSDSFLHGLTSSTGGPFYAPIAWLTFVFDWFAWGDEPYPIAFENLLLHITNTILLYFLAWKLWKSKTAAWWTAVGFTLLFPSNTWAVMWIATRAHLLATFFFLTAMLATLEFIGDKNKRRIMAVIIIIAGSGAFFSKENGLTLIVSLTILFLYEKKFNKSPDFPLVSSAMSILLTLSFAAVIYLQLRSSSGAVPLNFNNDNGYSYIISSKILLSNFLHYGWRTFGLIIILGGSIIFSKLLLGSRLKFDSKIKNSVLLSITLYTAAIAPFISLPMRSGIYTYLPGAMVSLMLGATVFCFSPKSTDKTSKSHTIKVLPIFLVVAIYSIFTVGHSLKWIQMARNTTLVLDQIVSHQPIVEPHTFFVLTYAERDKKNRFPDGFAEWGFSYALKIRYSDSTLNGKIVQQNDCHKSEKELSEIHFSYVFNDENTPLIIKTVKQTN